MLIGQNPVATFYSRIKLFGNILSGRTNFTLDNNYHDKTNHIHCYNWLEVLTSPTLL